MNEERQRLTKGLAAALALHLAAAALVGFLGYSFVTRPPQILEVTLFGGGGAPQEVIEEPQEESVVRSIDDIIDKRLKPETRKVVKKKPVKPSPQVSKNPAPSAANPDAAGNGEAMPPAAARAEEKVSALAQAADAACQLRLRAWFIPYSPSIPAQRAVRELKAQPP